MRKIILIPLVVCIVAVVTIAGFIFLFPDRGFHEDFKGEWGVEPIIIGSSSGGPQVEINTSVYRETSTNLSVTVLLSSYITVVRNYNETISKTEKLGGLLKCSGEFAGYWMLWIDTLNVSQTASLNIPGNLVGVVPFIDPLNDPCWLEGPFIFEVDIGELLMSDNTEKYVWIFYATNKDLVLFYDIETGLLLEAMYYDPNITTLAAMKMTLLWSNY